MVKPPIVYTAGLLRAAGKGVDTEAWTWLCANAGQQLFFPRNVSGWNDERWLDTATSPAGTSPEGSRVQPGSGQGAGAFDADKLLERALDFWGDPPISAATRRVLRGTPTGPWPPPAPRAGRRRLPSPDRKLPSPPDRGVPRLPTLVAPPQHLRLWRADAAPEPPSSSPRSSTLKARQSASSGLVLAPQGARKCHGGTTDVQLLQRVLALLLSARPSPRRRTGRVECRSGRDRSRPADVRLRSTGLALAVYGAGALKLPLFEEGVLEAAEAAPAQPVLVSVFLDGGADSSRCLRRSAIPTTAGFDPSSRSPTPVSLSPRTRASAGIHPPPRCGRCISKAS